jgi:hypothetical protein
MSRGDLRPDQIHDFKYQVDNLLVNPGFEIWQRGAGPFTGNNQYTADEWELDTNHGLTVTQETDLVKTGSSSAKLVHVPSANNARLSQGIENYKSLEGLWVTFSMWVYTSAPVLLLIQDYTSAGAETTGSAAHSGVARWERLTATKQIRTDLTSFSWPHGAGMRVIVYLDDDTPGTYYLDGAVLAVGYMPHGVPYAPLPVAEDYDRCLRFYEAGVDRDYKQDTGSTGVTDSRISTAVHFSTIKAAVPTLTTATSNPIGSSTNATDTITERDFRNEWHFAAQSVGGTLTWSAEVG